MSLIFISHSRHDNRAAGDLKRLLEEQGHHSVFLDLDPESGIPAGTDWEQTLYSKLRACQAVIFLCSPASLASKWCFAEVTHARSLGKALFPLKIAPCEPDNFLLDTQFIDLTLRPWNLDALWLGLGKAGLDDGFTWDGNRGPYPGLTAFQEEDAPLFFGRKTELEKGIEQLRSLRRAGGSRLILYQGASGCGKSSLVRAGLVPKLKRSHADWVVVTDPFRPSEGLNDPFDNLAAVLHASFEAGQPTKEALRQRFLEKAQRHPLLQVARELAEARKRREATVLVIVDQFEELLGEVSDYVHAFLAWLGDALVEAQRLPSCPLIVLATLRSDFLTSFQDARDLAEVDPAWFPVRPVPKSRLGEIIQRPAEIVGLKLESGLVQRILDDVGTDDALPMLAFTMSQLWERYGQDGALTIDEYDDLGGLRGSIRRVAERAFSRFAQSLEVEAGLRRAFLRMVEVNTSGQFVRRRARSDELEASVLPVLDHFAGPETRLLIKHENTYEVAHEALFRVWDKLAGWLGEERAFFVWLNKLRPRIGEWQQSGHEESTLIRGTALVEAERWLTERAVELTEDVLDFIRVSCAVRDRDHLLVERRRRRVLVISAATTFVFMLLALFSLNQWRAAEEQRTVSLAHQLAAQAELLRNQQPDLIERSLLLGLESLKRFRTVEGDHAVRQAMAILPPMFKSFSYGDFVRDVEYSADGRWLAVGHGGGVALLDGVSGEELWAIADGYAIYSVAFDAGGEWVAAAGQDGKVRLLDLSDGAEIRAFQHESTVWDVAIRPDGRVMVSGSWDHSVRLWDIETGRELRRMEHEDLVYQVAFDPGGQLVASTSNDGTARVWDGTTGDELYRIRDDCSYPVCGGRVVAFSGDGRFVVAGGRNGAVRTLELATGLQRQAPSHTGEVSAIAISPDGQIVATGGGENFPGNSGEVILWQLATHNEIARLSHAGPVRAIAFHPDGVHLASSSEDRTANVWDLRSGEAVIRTAHDYIGFDVAFDPAGHFLAMAGGAALRIAPWRTNSESTTIPLEADVTALQFSPDGSRLAIWSGDVLQESANIVVVDSANGRELARSTHLGQSGIANARFSSDLELVAVVTSDAVEVLSSSTGQRAGRYTVDAEGVSFETVTFARESDVIAVGASIESEGGQTGFASVVDWRTGDERLRVEHRAGVYSLSLSRDGRRLASASSDILGRWGEARIDRIDGAGTVWVDLAVPVDTLSFSPDGRFLVAGGNDNDARVFDASTGREVASLPHEGYVQSSAFSDDSRWFATGSLDNTARIWETGTWREVGRIVHDDAVYGVSFSSGGNMLLATGSLDNTTRISLWELESLLRRACLGVNRNLTEEEWRTYLGDESYEATCPDLP